VCIGSFVCVNGSFGCSIQCTLGSSDAHKALLNANRSLLYAYRALLNAHRALLNVYRTLLNVYRALFGARFFVLSSSVCV